MEVDEGGEGYGFARRNSSARKKVGRRTAVHTSAPVAPAAYVPQLEKPVWVWLLIGFLLGTGGTLLTASFWLPETGERHIVALDTGASEGNELNRTAVGPSVSEAAVPKVVEPPRAAGDEQDEESTSAAALDIEIPAATSSVGEPLSGSDDARRETLAASPSADVSDSEAEDEAQLPTVAADAGDDSDESLIDARPQATPADQEQVLAALDLETQPIDVPEPAPTLDDRPVTPDEDQRVRTEPSTPQIQEPIFEAARANPPVAAPSPVAASSDDQPPQEVVSPPVTVAEAAPANSVSQRELPPRIRQALQSARDRSANSENGRSGSRLYRVQLAAVDNEAAARIYWREANERLPGVFADVEPIFDQRLVDKRLFLRIWVGAFDNRLDADGYCGWLKLQGQDCFVTRVDNL